MSAHTCNAWRGSLGCRACQESEDRARAAKPKTVGVFYQCDWCHRTGGDPSCPGRLRAFAPPTATDPPIDARSYRKGIDDAATGLAAAFVLFAAFVTVPLAYDPHPRAVTTTCKRCGRVTRGGAPTCKEEWGISIRECDRRVRERKRVARGDVPKSKRVASKRGRK